MSRGFVKEDDQEEPVFIPPRAPLPEGFENLVTPRGLKLLNAERAELESARTAVALPEGPARRREIAEINGRLALLEQRIASARLVEANAQPDGQVRFGSTVTFRILTGPQQGAERAFSLVGVDEAKVAEGRIAYTAPIARSLLGHKAGDEFDFTVGAGVQRILVLHVG
jgi:transcription elongation factor GreB